MDYRHVDYLFDHIRPEAVIHLAARVGGIQDNIANPFDYFEQNLIMNSNVLRASRKFGVEKFITTLSTCCYPDEIDVYPMKEEDLHKDLPNRNNLGYAYAKRAMGLEIDIAREKGMDYSYIIPSNLYGFYEHGSLERKHFIGALISKIIDAERENSNFIELMGDGTPLRQFTYAGDIARLITEIIENNISVNMNASIDEALTINQITNIALEASNNKHLEIRYDTTKPNGQYRKDVSVDKLKKVLPNFKFTSYIDGIRATYEHIKGLR